MADIRDLFIRMRLIFFQECTAFIPTQVFVRTYTSTQVDVRIFPKSSMYLQRLTALYGFNTNALFVVYYWTFLFQQR